MSDKYYRGLRNILNDTKYKLQLATMTLKINENKNSISDNLGKINDNDNNIDEIRSNLNNIKNDLSDFKINYSIQNLFLFDINVERTYTLNKDNPEFNIFSYNLEDDLKSNVILEFNCKILYNYNSYNSIGHLTHIYKLYDENNKLIYEYKFLKANAGDNLSAYLNQNDLFYVKLNNNYTIIKIKLFLSIIDKNKSVTCKLLNTFKSNFLVVKLYKKINILSINNNLTDIENDISSNLLKINNNSSDITSNLTKINNNSSDISSNLSDISSNLSKINNNSSDISSNLININTNEDNIAYNLNEINYLKNNNKSVQYLKNVYNILIYDSKTQISFKEEDIFYEKVFDINADINDFVEIFFKIQLEYRDTDDRHYVKSIYELFDENNNSLYVKTVNNNEYLYFSNKMTIDENIFYNFNKNIKKLNFLIKLQKVSASRVIYLYYIKNDNYRLILKHYGN